MTHVPVLLNEVLQFLDPRPNKNFIDATFGGGGHSAEILKKIRPQGKILGIDADTGVVARAENFDKYLIVVHSNFRQITEIASKQWKVTPIDGILFDLGLSSIELDDPDRGFSFQKSGPLDMRFDQTTGKSAADIVNQSADTELTRIFSDYGEERFSKLITRAIVKQRLFSPIITTTALFDIIKQALPGRVKHKVADSARRIFQALRIAVNGELESLEAVLPQAVKLLPAGGRLVIISFHSLEDRIVKRYFLELARGCVCPPEFPECICGHSPVAKILTRKPVRASNAELAANPRSKPAKLRAIQKM